MRKWKIEHVVRVFTGGTATGDYDIGPHYVWSASKPSLSTYNLPSAWIGASQLHIQESTLPFRLAISGQNPDGEPKTIHIVSSSITEVPGSLIDGKLCNCPPPSVCLSYSEAKKIRDALARTRQLLEG